MTKVYLAGGAVRDLVMNRTPEDYDYVIMGTDEQTLLSNGFRNVGRSGTVFLHPVTNDECALIANDDGDFNGSRLTDNLSGRDLTINSMAVLHNPGEPPSNLSGLIDPFFGRRDILSKVLRHTSDAFRDDPVRILRLARFRARFGSDWSVAPETVALCREIISAGGLATLVKERVWKELSRALSESDPRLFFDTLDEIGALSHIFPEVGNLKNVQENREFHPEGNTYEHTMLVLTAMRGLTSDTTLLFSALTHDFGKLLTDPALYPRHHKHEVVGVPVVSGFARRLGAPLQTERTAALLSRYHMHMKRLEEMKPGTYLKMLHGLGVFSNPQMVSALVLLGMADSRGRLGCENADVSKLSVLQTISDAATGIRFSTAMALSGKSGLVSDTDARRIMDDARHSAIKSALSKIRGS